MCVEGGFSQIQLHLYNLSVGTINSMMNLEQFSPIVLICIETKCQVVDWQWLYQVVDNIVILIT